MVVAAGLAAKRAGDPALAEARCAGDQEILVTIDPFACGEPGEDGAVEASRRAQVDVLDAGVLAQGSELQAGGETLGVALGGLAIDEQSKALLEREGVEIGGASLLLEGLGHSGQAESAQALEGGVCQHRDRPCR